MEIIDSTNLSHDINPSCGQMLVKRDPDQSFIPSFAKDGDVGLDLPVKISIEEAKFSLGKDPDKLRNPMLYPDFNNFIFPSGDKDTDKPFLIVPPFGWAEVPSAISIKLPDDAWGMIKTRSSTAWKKRLIVSTSTIDCGYTGLLGTLVFNPNQSPVRVFEYDPKTRTGDCLSQLILIPRYQLNDIILVDDLPKTQRGKTGFGSTTKSIK